jgi:hypothetical protein
MGPQGCDLGFDALRMTQERVALVGRRRLPPFTIGLVGAHVLNADAHGAQASQCLQRVEVPIPVAAVPAARIAGDWAGQPNILVIAQRWLAEPRCAATRPGWWELPCGQGNHTSSA